MKNSILILLLLLIINCKNQTKNNVDNKQNFSINNTKSVIEKNVLEEYNLSQFQGIWKSFSYYLEHEEDDKDEHKNEYYKIVSKNKCLDIILKQHDIDEIIYKTYELGFIDDKNQKRFKKTFLKDKGKFLVRDLKKVYQRGSSVQEFFDEFNISENVQRNFDTYELLEDGFDYENFEIVEKVQFKKVLTLPLNVYRKLKEASQSSSISYIESFDINKLSSKIIVNVSKCYFYEDKDLKVKKRAFLIKNDEAYLEEVNDKSVKVYFDGKVITSGYLDKSKVEIVQR